VGLKLTARSPKNMGKGHATAVPQLCSLHFEQDAMTVLGLQIAESRRTPPFDKSSHTATSSANPRRRMHARLAQRCCLARLGLTENDIAIQEFRRATLVKRRSKRWA
jgi:hypothetical protein